MFWLDAVVLAFTLKICRVWKTFLHKRFARFASAQLWKMISLRALATLFVLEKINCIYVFQIHPKWHVTDKAHWGRFNILIRPKKTFVLGIFAYSRCVVCSFPTKFFSLFHSLYNTRTCFNHYLTLGPKPMDFSYLAQTVLGWFPQFPSSSYTDRVDRYKDQRPRRQVWTKHLPHLK